VALDGTKVAANAAMDRNRTREKLSEQEKALLAEVEALLGRAEATDKDEDDRYGDDSGDGLPMVESAEAELDEVGEVPGKVLVDAGYCSAVFGQIKDCRRLARFLLRGLCKVKGEFELWCLTHNLLKLYRHGLAGG